MNFILQRLRSLLILIYLVGSDVIAKWSLMYEEAGKSGENP